jgi:hypothetical protein
MVFEMSMGIPKKKSLLPLVMSGLNQHGNEASVFYQKNMAVSFSKIPPYAQDGGQCAGAFLKCQWGSVKKKEFAIVSHVRAKPAWQ